MWSALLFRRLCSVAKIKQLHGLKCLWQQSDVVHVCVVTGKQVTVLFWRIAVFKIFNCWLTAEPTNQLMCDDSVAFVKGIKCYKLCLHFHMFHFRALRNVYIYVVNQQTHTDALSYINIYQHILVAFATIIMALYKNTNNILHFPKLYK